MTAQVRVWTESAPERGEWRESSLEPGFLHFLCAWGRVTPSLPPVRLVLHSHPVDDLWNMSEPSSQAPQTPPALRASPSLPTEGKTPGLQSWKRLENW